MEVVNHIRCVNTNTFNQTHSIHEIHVNEKTRSLILDQILILMPQFTIVVEQLHNIKFNFKL
jgi:hypothetical protein